MPQVEIPIQPVADPILCRPYEEPNEHWVYDTGTGVPSKNPGRRPASYWYKSERTGSAQRALFAEEERDDLPLVNALREDVRRWRKAGWPNSSQTTKKLLRHWWRQDRARRLFFCQLEAVETVLYIREILSVGKNPRWKPRLSLDEFRLLEEGRNPRPTRWVAKVAQHPKLADVPGEPGSEPIRRYACKMATGAGKTVVMAMLVAWAFCNRGAQPSDPRYPRRVLVVCPNLTIKERLSVLRPTDPDNQVQAAAPGQDRTPPVMIVVCDNTTLAAHFHKMISGEEVVEDRLSDTVDLEEEDGPSGTRRKTKPRFLKHFGSGLQGFDELWNREGGEVTLRIDSKLLEAAESGDPNATRKDAAEELRKIVSTIGQPGEPGAKVRCVVSVNMLSEGWDANNVTEILGLRAFHSQLLCEQVVGRGLRRMDYTPDPETGLLTAEYVDIFGVPFSLIPFKGRGQGGGPPPEDRPKHEVLALPERKEFEIHFPVVEGYVVSLKRHRIACDIDLVERTALDPSTTPVAAFVQPQVSYKVGLPGAFSGFGFQTVDRQEYYRSVHPQTITFAIAREVVRQLTEVTGNGGERHRGVGRNALFPQVLRIVQAYIRDRVDLNGLHPCEVGLQTYAQRIAGLLVAAIRPDESEGEAPLLPRLNRYQPVGSTDRVHFKTVRPIQATTASHLNYVACDTASWEQAAMFQLERLALEGAVDCYARNDHLEFNIPYQLYGESRVYEPDFIVRLRNGVNVLLEIKGQSYEDTDAKHQAAKQWVSAVNCWGRLGEWEFLVCRDPQSLGRHLSRLIDERRARIRKAALLVHTQVERDVSRLRERGWKRADFTRALQNSLVADEERSE